jgi:uncharacterized OsmC-like protein
VTYQLRLHDAQRAVAERAHAIHADNCPVYRTIQGCVDITTSLQMEGLPVNSDDTPA